MNILDEKLADVEKIISNESLRKVIYDEIKNSIGKIKNSIGNYEWARIVMLIGGKNALLQNKKISITDIYNAYGLKTFYSSASALSIALGTAITGKSGTASSPLKIEEIEEELKKFDEPNGTYKWNWTLRELIDYIENNEAIAPNSKANLNVLLNIGSTYRITKNGGLVKVTSTDPYTLLETNMQLIMNGAPGTGKTYSARNEIADKLLGLDGKTDVEKKEVKEIRMDMVQFHPSYDYTDFIEGIRPVMTGTSSASGIGYTLKNGSFKKFCRRAGVIERLVAANKLINDQSIDDFLNGEDDEIKDFWKDWIKGSGISLINTLNNTITNPPKNEKTEDSKIERPNDGSEHNEKTEESIELPSFLFIIDEINRAEISKVLGETMYCLDPDYRGSKGRIATQYSAMATKESFFVNETNDKFFIPSNVYIIGTMNDIDRSVEVFDFALRRRFAWHEVKAEDVMDTVLRSMKIDQKLAGQYADYLSRIESLNEAIDNELKLNRHYYLGPSYFAKIELYLDSLGSNYKDALKDVWNNHISQILYEYVKGKRTEKEIEKIGETFMN